MTVFAELLETKKNWANSFLRNTIVVMEKQPNVKLIIAVHKECYLPEGEIYLPLHVGAACNECVLPYTRDDSGDNISKLNPLFCELTGLYWAWKNLDYDWLGLVHYRRFFSSKHKKSILQREELLPLLEKYRVILPRKRHYYIETIFSHHDHTFDGTQFEKTRQIILIKYPDYIEDFDLFMKQRSAWLFNMMIMPNDLLNNYCFWLFDILFELKEHVDISKMTAFEKRYIGRVSEYLLNVWIIHQIRLNIIQRNEVMELPYMYLGKVNWWKKGTSFLKAKFFKIKYKTSF